jgi:hypothetical protein
MKSAPGSITAMMVAVLLAWTTDASADGAVNIATCQTLSIPNTVYKLTTDLDSCSGSCLIVAADRITIDMQGHSIKGCQSQVGAAMFDQDSPRDVIVVKNGSVSGFRSGVDLFASTRVTVLGVTAANNLVGIAAGVQALVKSSEAFFNDVGIRVSGRGQVQQCNAQFNNIFGIHAVGGNCLITMNTANANLQHGIVASGDRCTVSYNTARENLFVGIAVGGGAPHLITRNVALDNAIDYGIVCPSDVTYNESTNGFPASYERVGTGRHFVDNQ